MIKQVLRKIVQNYGYDFVKTEKFVHGKPYKAKSNVEYLDYYTTPIGNYYFPKNCIGDGVANTMKDGKIFDKHIIDIATSFIKKDTYVLDIGANYGQMAIEFSKLVGIGMVYAFEAQQMVYDVLVKNLNENKATKVKPFYNAVFNHSDVDLVFPVPDLVRFPTYGSYGIDLNTTEGVKVKSIAIDSIDFDKPISFMKIDIQGSDLFAMQGAVETIKKHQMPIIFEYEEQFQPEFNTSFQDYVDFVDNIGYKFDKTVESINYLIVPKN